MRVHELVGTALARLGVREVFGVVGSGNFHVTNALIDSGATYLAARHEGGAATMADACARVGGRVTALTLHQGCGMTNAMTGIAEAAKSRTPMLVLAAETRQATSNFHVDQAALAVAVGAVPMRVTSAAACLEQTLEAYLVARDERRTVVLNLPLEVQGEPVDPDLADRVAQLSAPPRPAPPEPSAVDVERVAAVLARARRPVLLAGRGARHARAEVIDLAEAGGALVATSAVARGLFHEYPWSLDVSGGFSSPLAAELITSADVIVALGCSMTMWTMRHGRLVGPETTLVQVDVEQEAIGRHRPVHLGVVGDAARVASATADALRANGTGATGQGWRTEELGRRIAREIRWRDVGHEDWGTGEGPDDPAARVDPRTLTVALDDALPDRRLVCVDSGNFMGYPSMYLAVPDEQGFCFTQAFQSVGLGLATAIGAARARPDRLVVAALGDGGATMGAAELDTVRRLATPMVVVVYDDAGYGAEVHHFTGEPMETVTFGGTDLAAVARGYGLDAVTVRHVDHVAAVREWVAGRRERSLLVHAHVAAPRGSWWLEEAFRGH